MSKYGLLFLFVWFAFAAAAQVAPNKYYIQFTDKKNSPYSLNKPEQFLTQRALERRKKYGIAIQENDLPVNPQYIKAVAGTGVKILNASRWLNGVTVFTNDTHLIDSIRRFPFVKKTVKFVQAKRQYEQYRKFKKEAVLPNDFYPVFKSSDTLKNVYGAALTQIKQINGVYLHKKGYRGKGVVIAVLDAGFSRVLTQPLFDSLRNDHRLLGTRDFVNPGGDVFPQHYHGRMVLSCMAADIPGVMVGTAPKASYWLLRTEDAPTENVIEEYNWVSGAEFADSVGADIINSSLGYTSFDNPAFSHPYSDMNGRTCISTRGAEIAASKGILVVNSAGNSGNSKTFPWIGAPADGDSVLTVGAVTATGVRASFSSIGPTFDGRIKPTVMAMGQGDAVADAYDSVIRASGTSFSSPVIAGMCACLWEAFPQATNMQIEEALKKSASFANDPDSLVGWGIPDFAKAYTILQQTVTVKPTKMLYVFPNPFQKGFTVKLPEKGKGECLLSLYEIGGKLLFHEKYAIENQYDVDVYSVVLARLPSGIYLLKLTENGKSYYGKLCKQ